MSRDIEHEVADMASGRVRYKVDTSIGGPAERDIRKTLALESIALELHLIRRVLERQEPA